MISGSALSYAISRIAGMGGGVNLAGLTDYAFMSASQTFPMSADPATPLAWVGPNSPSASWCSSAGVVTPGLYNWRIRFWTATAPAASNIKMVAFWNSSADITCQVFNVDDLTFGSAYRPGMHMLNVYGSGDSGAAPTCTIHFSAVDATGVLRYDMSVFRMAY